MKPEIILPDNITLLRSRAHQNWTIPVDVLEYSMYFRNILHPYSDEYDVKIGCDYGKNLGNCWRIDRFDDLPDRFPVLIRVYLYGELLARKEITVHLVCRNERPVSVMCVGDSMTWHGVYIRQACQRAENVTSVGTCKMQGIAHEGRPGWSLQRYVENGFFASPFLFPEGISPEQYYGDWKFMEAVQENPNLYYTVGYSYAPIREGMCVLTEEGVCRYQAGRFHSVESEPAMQLDFEKFLRHNDLAAPDVVSFLFGANDLQITDYEDTLSEIKCMLPRLRQLVDGARKIGAKIVINLPVCGADQYGWGNACGCRGTVKQYDYNMKMWSKALIEAYDNREDEGIFLCPMLAFCDPEAGFSTAVSVCNQHTERTCTHFADWVHPNESGYRQMGDVLAATVTKICRTL